MTPSIESIWKEGFLQDGALVAPKVNDLYNQKSIHTIAKFKRMFHKNIKAIIIGSFILLPISWLVKMSVLGIMMFFILNAMAFVDWQKLKELNAIEEQVNSYEYLKKVQIWMQGKTKINTFMAQLLYPYVLLTITVSFWMMDINGVQLGHIARDSFLEFFPNTALFNGIPIIGMSVLALGMIVLYFLAERIYRSEIELVYGAILSKLDELVKDMEALEAV